MLLVPDHDGRVGAVVAVVVTEPPAANTTTVIAIARCETHRCTALIHRVPSQPRLAPVAAMDTHSMHGGKAVNRQAHGPQMT